MPQYTAAFRARAKKLGFDPITIATFAWAGGTERYSERAMGFAGLPCFPRLLEVQLSASEIGMKPGGIVFPEGSALLANKDRRITRILQAGPDHRGLACSLIWAASGLPLADCHTRFSGLTDRFEEEQGGDAVRVTMRANDGPLQGLVPKSQIVQAEAPLAPATSRGIYYPIIYGSHDASGLTGRGMVPAIPWAIDTGSSQWRFVVMLGYASDIPRVYLNSTLKTLTTDYVFSYPVVGGKRITSIDFTSDPGENAVVTCDVDGIEDVGDGTGNLITNRVEQLLHLLTNFGFGDARDPNVYGWIDPNTVPIDVESLARGISHASAFQAEGAIRLGGSTEAQAIEGFIQQWLLTNPVYRPYWTKGAGAFGLAILPDLRFPGYYSPGASFTTEEQALFVRGQIHDLDDSLTYAEDTSLLMRRVDMQHLFGAQDQKFFGSLALQDVSQEDDVSEAYAMTFSLAKLL